MDLAGRPSYKGNEGLLVDAEFPYFRYEAKVAMEGSIMSYLYSEGV